MIYKIISVEHVLILMCTLNNLQIPLNAWYTVYPMWIVVILY